MRHGRLLLAAWVAVLFVPALRAQAPEKPGPELDALKELEGEWDATVKAGGMESKGTMAYKMGLGGRWLIGKFEGEMGGQKFEGRSLNSYDATKKKYVNVWVDSMSGAAMLSEGSYDKDTKTLTLVGEGPGQDGKPAKYKQTSQVKDKDTIAFTMSAVGDGKEQEVMTITFKRKK
jgi:hypothetical protein